MKVFNLFSLRIANSYNKKTRTFHHSRSSYIQSFDNTRTRKMFGIKRIGFDRKSKIASRKKVLF